MKLGSGIVPPCHWRFTGVHEQSFERSGADRSPIATKHLDNGWRALIPGSSQGIERPGCGESYLEPVLEGHCIQGQLILQHNRAVSLGWGDWRFPYSAFVLCWWLADCQFFWQGISSSVQGAVQAFKGPWDISFAGPPSIRNHSGNWHQAMTSSYSFSNLHKAAVQPTLPATTPRTEKKKQIKTPYLFFWEHMVVLREMNLILSDLCTQEIIKLPIWGGRSYLIP